MKTADIIMEEIRAEIAERERKMFRGRNIAGLMRRVANSPRGIVQKAERKLMLNERLLHAMHDAMCGEDVDSTSKVISALIRVSARITECRKIDSLFSEWCRLEPYGRKISSAEDILITYAYRRKKAWLNLLKEKTGGEKL